MPCVAQQKGQIAFEISMTFRLAPMPLKVHQTKNNIASNKYKHAIRGAVVKSADNFEKIVAKEVVKLNRRQEVKNL